MNGTWSGSPTNYAYQWEECDSTDCIDVAAATAATYVPHDADVGHSLRVEVRATNNIGTSAIAYSAKTDVVSDASSGGTLGPTVPGALLDPGATGYIVLSGRYQVSGPITLTQLSGYTSGGSQVSHLRAVVYADNNGEPGNLITTSSEVTIAAHQVRGLGRLRALPTGHDQRGRLLARLLVRRLPQHPQLHDQSRE